MPTNVTPEYRKAEQAFRQARDPKERLACLKEMLRTIPKHKGSEHLQADIKSRIKALTDELAGPKKTGSRSGTLYAIRPEGAAQVALIGPPNSGKSCLHQRLTGSHAEVGPYPYTTKLPMPGMLAYEDIHFQLVDLPPTSADYMEPWLAQALERADAAFLVVDVSDPECPDHILAIRSRLREKKILLLEGWPTLAAGGLAMAAPSEWTRDKVEDDIADPFRIELPTLLIANKCDLDPDPEEVQVLEELLGVHYPAVTTSAKTGQGLGSLGELLFRGLEIVRVYTKAPGRPPDTERPFTLRRGATVLDVAERVHKDFVKTLKFVRLWGSSQFEGQHVGPDHKVADRDVVELHT
ncbi:MAG: GTPase [Gammaproteobacteria bacterium]